MNEGSSKQVNLREVEKLSNPNSPTKRLEKEYVFLPEGGRELVDETNTRQPSTSNSTGPVYPLLTNLDTTRISIPSVPFSSDTLESSLVGWFVAEGLSLEEAKLFDKQFLHSRFPNNNDFEQEEQSMVTRTWVRLILLTLTLLGLQFAWCLELAYGTPYLLSLGLSKPMMSLVWLAGPLSGLIMQPLIGAISDKFDSKLGRRRPFLLVGGFFTLFALVSIGWTQELVEGLGGSSDQAKYIAVFAFYILDFAINTIQAASRALIVDVLPAKLQEEGNAWAGRMIGLGSVLGGYLDLVKAFPLLGDKQLKILSFFACVLLILCLGITCGMIREIPYVEEPNPTNLNCNPSTQQFPLITALHQIYLQIQNLPQPIAKLCKVQFFAWIGWFPYLFYGTKWVSEFVPIPPVSELALGPMKDVVGDTTRDGSKAFVISSLVSLIAAFLIPYLTKPTAIDFHTNPNHSTKPQWFRNYFPTMSHHFTFSLILFGMLMLGAGFVKDISTATVVIALSGISWAVTMWAPFALIGEYVHKSKGPEFDDYLPLQNLQDGNDFPPNPRAREGTELSPPPAYAQATTNLSSNPGEPTAGFGEPNVNYNRPDAGMLLGIHNIFIVIPQFLTALLASFIFLILGSDTSFGFLLQLGGFTTLLAAYHSIQLWKV